MILSRLTLFSLLRRLWQRLGLQRERSTLRKLLSLFAESVESDLDPALRQSLHSRSWASAFGEAGIQDEED